VAEVAGGGEDEVDIELVGVIVGTDELEDVTRELVELELLGTLEVENVVDT